MNSKSEFMKKLENLVTKVKDGIELIVQMLTPNFNERRVYIINKNPNV